MSDLRCCRFCYEAVTSNHAINLFSQKSNLVNLSSRLSELLQLPVSLSDGLSPYTCRLCRDRLLNLKRKLANTRDTIRGIYEHASRESQSQLSKKRTKETSGNFGVSPSTAKNQPPRKKIAACRTLFPQGAKHDIIKYQYVDSKLTDLNTISTSEVTSSLYCGAQTSTTNPQSQEQQSW